MVRNSSAGMQILLMSASNHVSRLLNDSVNISNCYLPSECGDNKDRCDILYFENSGFSYYIIPSIQGFVTLSHGTDYEDVQTSFISIVSECNPTQAFYDDYSNNIAIACMDLQTQENERIYYLPYRLALNNDDTRGSIIRNLESYIESEHIFNPETVSKVLHVRGQVACAAYDNLYFVDDAFVLHYTYPFDAFYSQFIESNQELSNCIGYTTIEYYGNDELLIRCSNGQTIIYDSCASYITDTFSSSSAVPYPCTNWDYVIYKNRSHLVLKKGGNTLGTLELPFRNLTYGKCIQSNDLSTFIMLSADGTTFIASFNGANWNTLKILNGFSLQVDSDTETRKYVFSDNKKVFGVFDSVADNLVIVKLTQAHAIVNVSTMSFRPDLISIPRGKGVSVYTIAIGI